MSITLITGTSTGIGQTTALHLARRGHHVFASMRDPATGSSVLTEAAGQEGLKLTCCFRGCRRALSSGAWRW